jgi:hypothetical protein
VEFSAQLRKDLATTYSRRSYTTTTIGKTVFDGRVRDGNGSGHSFMVTKKSVLGQAVGPVGTSRTGQTGLTEMLKSVCRVFGQRVP